MSCNTVTFKRGTSFGAAVLSSGSITIDADAFVAPYYQVYGAYDYAEAITSIGKLTAF